MFLNKKIKVNYVLIIILILALFLRIHRINHTFVKNHDGWNGSFYSLIAENYLSIGFFKLRFAPHLWISADKLQYYLHHPPLVGLLTSIMFKIFGKAEWSARIPFLFSSLVNIVLIYMLAKKMFNKNIGFLAAFLFSLVPMASFYDLMVDPQGSLILTFILLMSYSYYLFLKGEKKYFKWLIISFAVSVIIDWGSYLFLIILSLHYFLYKRRFSKEFFLLFSLPLIFLSIFVVYSLMITGSIEGAGLFQTLIYSFFTKEPEMPENFLVKTYYYYPFSIEGYIKRILEYWLLLYTPPLLILSLLWLFSLSTNFFRKKNINLEDQMIILFFIFGLSYIIILKNAAYYHDYNSYYLLPFFTISSSIVLFKLVMMTNNKKLKTIIIVLFLIFTSIFSIKTLLQYSFFEEGEEFYKIGKFLRENTNHNEKIIFSGTFTPQLNYYSERRIEYGVTHPQHVIDLAESDNNFKFYVRYTPIELLTKEQEEKFKNYENFRFNGVFNVFYLS